MRNVKHVKI